MRIAAARTPSARITFGRIVIALMGLASVLALLGAIDAAAHELFAQTPARNPFAVGVREGSGPPSSGFASWVLAEQMRFERMLAGAVRAIKTDAAALWTLLGISFAYGVFHAAGPGHGKAVVASYMLANERSLRRGIAISLMAALLQGVVAVLIVGVLAAVLNATSARMREAANLVELASYAGVALLGAWLVWRKGRGLLAAFGAQEHQAHDHKHDHAHHGRDAPGLGHDHELAHTHAHDLAHAHAHAPAKADTHVHDEHCGHFHAPAPEMLTDRNFSWKGAILTVFAAGARPCSGAILVLVFALAQGIFAAGIAAAFAMSLGTAITTGALAAMAVLAKGLASRFLGDGSPRGVLAVRALELVAAILVLMLGASLLLGALAGGVAPA